MNTKKAISAINKSSNNIVSGAGAIAEDLKSSMAWMGAQQLQALDQSTQAQLEMLAQTNKLLEEQVDLKSKLAKYESEAADATKRLQEIQVKQLEREQKIKDLRESYAKDLYDAKGDKKAQKKAKDKYAKALQGYGENELAISILKDKQSSKTSGIANAANGIAGFITGGSPGIGGSVGGIGKAIGAAFPIAGAITQAVGSVLSNIEQRLGAIAKTLETSISSGIDFSNKQMGKINANLETSGNKQAYASIMKAIDTSGLADSGFVNIQDLYQKIVEFSDNGILFNIEERALLSTMGDKIVSSFNALDQSITRLTRLQSADVTEAQLGSQARLRTFLNDTFNNSEYMKDMYNSVYGAILDSNAQLDVSAATEFSYSVEKWLGALYSVGVSSETINKIASGINYLGTGNVQALASDTALQTLFAQASSKAGVSYSDLLLDSLDSSEIDKLMRSIVEVLQNIESNTTNNQVTASAFSNIYGTSVADIKAVSNLTSTQLDALAGESLNYQQAYDEVKGQFESIAQYRTTLGERLTNAYQSAMFQIGSRMSGDSSNLQNMEAWILGDMVDQFGGGLIGAIAGEVIGDQFGFDISSNNMVGDQQLSFGQGFSDLLNVLGSAILGGSYYKYRAIGSTAIDALSEVTNGINLSSSEDEGTSKFLQSFISLTKFGAFPNASSSLDTFESTAAQAAKRVEGVEESELEKEQLEADQRTAENTEKISGTLSEIAAKLDNYMNTYGVLPDPDMVELPHYDISGYYDTMDSQVQGYYPPRMNLN